MGLSRRLDRPFICLAMLVGALGPPVDPAARAARRGQSDLDATFSRPSARAVDCGLPSSRTSLGATSPPRKRAAALGIDASASLASPSPRVWNRSATRRQDGGCSFDFASRRSSRSSVLTWIFVAQCRVSPDANEPFSNSLFAGAPPPHTAKNSQRARHFSTPSAISPTAAWKRVGETWAASVS